MSKSQTSVLTKMMHNVRDQNDADPVDEIIATHERRAARKQLLRVGLMTAAAVGAVVLVATTLHNLLEDEETTEDE